ncbi:MAG: FAD-binding protein [Bacteroidetes bacterium]|nr:FAD-binding protein [Bacteroidota bacterium]
MIKEIEIAILPEQQHIYSSLEKAVALQIRVPKEKINDISIIKRSIDARKEKVLIRLKVKVFTNESRPAADFAIENKYKFVKNADTVIIVGSGPAGLFAALRLIELGLKPVIIERGKDIHLRKYDIAELNREQKVNPDSNYCFGEGGAGTYSDGKLYTRSTKRGNVNDILEKLTAHGASQDILIDAHPHIGTDKLPAIISNIRETIIAHGGEFYFEKKVVDFLIKENTIKGVIDQEGTLYEGKAVILATGHSARDIYELLQQKNILLEAKPFALGIRIEHPQHIIDSIQYHSKNRSQYLPAATYQLVTQVEGKGVFSFCMCPGGIIVPSATNDGQIVVNGMSNSRRNSPYANAGMVVSVELSDLEAYQKYNALAGLKFQEDIEKAAFNIVKDGQIAPAQRMTDFVNNKISSSLNPSSYIPGLVSARMDEILPDFISQRLRQAFINFDQKMKGYLCHEANIVGVESRTSSPVRIPRDNESMQHLQIKNLYPCGEGAGYAGGIISSALDGVAAAEKIAL